MRLAYAAFRDALSLESALRDLFAYGWTSEDLSLVSRADATIQHMPIRDGVPLAGLVGHGVVFSFRAGAERWRASASRVSRAIVDLPAAPHDRRGGFLQAIMPPRSIPELDALLASGGWLLLADAPSTETERQACMTLLAHADSNVHVADFVRRCDKPM
jgi:hypothetical protein